MIICKICNIEFGILDAKNNAAIEYSKLKNYHPFKMLLNPTNNDYDKLIS